MIPAVLTTAVVTAVTTAVILEALRLVRQWRDARAVIHLTQHETDVDMPVPYRLAADTEIRVTQAMVLAAFCGPCRDAAGDCACTVPCGHPECLGGFSDDDVDFLHGLTTPEGGDQ